MSDMVTTPARDQATFLRALADHLDAYADLVPVALRSPTDRPILDVHADVAAVVAWARSLNVGELAVFGYRAGDGFVHLQASAELDGHGVELQGYVHDLDPADYAVLQTVALDDPRLAGGAR